MEWAVPNFPLSLSLCSRIGGNTFFVAASQVTEMLQGNIIAPYNIKSKVWDKSRWGLGHNHSSSLLRVQKMEWWIARGGTSLASYLDCIPTSQLAEYEQCRNETKNGMGMKLGVVWELG